MKKLTKVASTTLCSVMALSIIGINASALNESPSLVNDRVKITYKDISEHACTDENGNIIPAEYLNNWSVQINNMTKEQREEMQNKTGNKVSIANAYLSKNNQDGTSGSVCSQFTADKTGFAFVITNAPGASNYNVKLYEGKIGKGKAVSNFAVSDINNGVYFTGLTVGKEYYVKISSSTLITSGCTATYETITFDA